MLYMRPSESATRAVYTCDHCFYGGQFAAAGARRGRAAVPRRPGRRVRHPGGSQTPPWRRGVVNAGVFATRARPGSGTAGTPTAGGAHAAPLNMRPYMFNAPIQRGRAPYTKRFHSGGGSPRAAVATA